MPDAFNNFTMATGRKFQRYTARSSTMVSSAAGWDTEEAESSGSTARTNIRRCYKPRTLQTSSITCTQHAGDTIEMYCVGHDTVCCAHCISAFHRTCARVESISNMVAEVSVHREKEETMLNLKRNLEFLKQHKSTKQNLTGYFGNLNNNELADAPVQKKRRSARLQAAEKESIEQAEAKLNETSDVDNADIRILNNIIEKTESKIKLIAQSDSSVDLFIDIKQSQQLVLDGKTLFDKLSNTTTENDSNHVQEKSELLSHVNMTTGEGNNKSGLSSSTLVGEFDMRTESDTIQCFVCDICVLDNDTVVIADSSNNKLKLLDSQFNVSSSCPTHGQPAGMSKSGPTEVACMIHAFDGKSNCVQFASSVGQTICLTRRFTVSEDCKFERGICCFNGEVYVICRDHMIKVYSMSGEILRTFLGYDLKHRGTIMARITTDDFDLIISDGYKRIYITDKHGTKKAIITDKRFKTVCSVCLGERNQLFANSYYSHSIFLMDKMGKNKTEILVESDGIYHPMAVAYQKSSKYLIVGSYGTNKIKVFKMK